MAEASPFGLFVLLAMGHFVGDFVLQNDRMAIEKCAGCDKTLPWFWWLTAHAACQGLIVALITGVPLLGLAEWVLHWLIDWGKCNKRYNLGVDQGLHLACKVVWVALLVTIS
jgi:hypothetical protein